MAASTKPLLVTSIFHILVVLLLVNFSMFSIFSSFTQKQLFFILMILSIIATVLLLFFAAAVCKEHGYPSRWILTCLGLGGVGGLLLYLEVKKK